MAKSTSCKEAIANFEKAKGVVAAEADKVNVTLVAVPFIYSACCNFRQQQTLDPVPNFIGSALWSSSSHRQDGRKPFLAESLQVSASADLAVSR